MNIDWPEMERAFKYLGDTDDSCAHAKALVEFLRLKTKTIKATLFLDENNGKSVADKESYAYSHEKYVEHLDKIRDAVYDYELQHNKRERANLIVDVWRSTNANRRAGNI